MPITDGDRLFVRHPSLGNSETYGGEIPGWRLETQSANSELINLGGSPLDVLLNITGGEHFHGSHQIACLDIRSLIGKEIPNENTVTYDRKGNITRKPDVYTFRPEHKPDKCMYPHCDIVTYKNGKPGQSISNGIKTALRAELALVAQRHRSEMLSIHN